MKPAGSGHEADKLSRRHTEAYYHGYFDPLAQKLGPLFGKSLRYVMMDSWEAGTNNWTDEIAAEFKSRRGYDPTPYLPALTGRIVENAELSDRFLWDFRRTLADLWADAHYGVMAAKLRERGIGIYAEAAGVSLEMPEDTLLNKSKVEIPMGEFWVRDLHPRLMYLQDVRGAAASPARTMVPPASSVVATVDGAWDVAFPEKLGAPPKITLPKLESLTVNSDDGIKCFSGTATVLDLGRVGDIAEVSLNGRALGQRWKPPYALDVTTALRPGENTLEIKVTNQWANRIAGDHSAPADKKVLAAAPPGRGGGGGFGGGPAPLPVSGLIGPVTVMVRSSVP